jgi:hypothetical protein
MPADPKTGFDYDEFATILARVRGDFDAAGLGYSRLARSLLYPFPYAIAAVSYLLQGRLRWVVKQAFVTIAHAANVRRWGEVVGVPPIPEAYAGGNVTFTGVAATAIPTGTELARADGPLYTVDAPGGVVGGGGTVSLAVTAAAPGLDGNALAGVTLTLTTPIAGVASTATVAAGDLTGGADEEAAPAQALRIQEHMADTPQGGAAADYVAWVRASQDHVDKVGVTHPSDNLVNVFFTMVSPYGLTSSVLPNGAQRALAQNYIDEEDADLHDIRRPVTASATVQALTATATVFSIAPGTLTATQQGLVESALDDVFARLQVPGSGYTVYREQLVTAAHNVLPLGSIADILVPAGDVVVPAGQIGTRGVTTWP